MTIMVLLVLAAIWAGVLVPPYLQKRRATHPSSSILDFHQQLAVLQRTGRALHGAELHAGYASRAYSATVATRPGVAPVPMHRMARHDVMRRRRDVVATLAAAALVTFVLALLLGGSVWLVQLLVDAALLGYLALLMQVQQTRRIPGSRDNVRHLPRAHSPTQAALLRRSAN